MYYIYVIYNMYFIYIYTYIRIYMCIYIYNLEDIKETTLSPFLKKFKKISGFMRNIASKYC